MAYLVCVDASIIIKWVIPERDSEQALDLLANLADRGAIFVEPALLLYEVPSAILRKVAKGQMSADEADEAFAKFQFLATRMSVSAEDRQRVQRAWTIASEHGLSRIYDSVYVALAEEFGADCWTADAKLHRAISNDFPRLKLLSDFVLTS